VNSLEERDSCAKAGLVFGGQVSTTQRPKSEIPANGWTQYRLNDTAEKLIRRADAAHYAHKAALTA
jgi:hypothetical protein